MKDNRIDRAEVFVVGPDVERYTWAEGMTEPVHGQRHPAADGGERPAGRRRRGDDHLARLRPLRRRDAAHRPARRDRQGPGRARGALAPHAQSRHADGAAGAFAGRHRALGHDGAAGRHCRSIKLLGGAREKILSYASTPLLADNQAYIDYVGGAPRGRLQGGQVPLLVRAGARPADVRGGAQAFRGHRTWR